MDSFSNAKRIAASLTALEKTENILNILIPDLMEINEKIAAIEALPKVLHMDEDIKWRPKLISKMRQQASEYEMQIRDLRQRDIEPHMEYLSWTRPKATLSLSFSTDLDVVIRYYQHMLRITLEDPLHRRTKLREKNFEETCCLERLNMSRSYPLPPQDEAYAQSLQGPGQSRDQQVQNSGRGGHRSQPAHKPSNHDDEPDDQEDEPLKDVRDIFTEQFMRWNNDRSYGKKLDYYFETTNNRNNSREYQTQLQPFSSDFTKKLLFNKHIAFIGDSLTRAIYKDLIRLLQCDFLLTAQQLKLKSETSHLGDRQIDSLPLDADKIFRQAREYCTHYHLVQYLFTTRVMKDDVEKFLLTFQKHGEFPDVLVINSALWDLTRYYDNDTDMRPFAPYEDNPRNQLEDETKTMREYVERISILMRRLRVILPAHTQVIWLLMPWPLPVGNSSLLNKNTGQRKLHRSIYLDGNYRAAQVVSNAGYDVLDISFYLRNHSLYPLRVGDGVHWSAVGTRLMTQLLIGHLAKNIILPADIKEKLETFHNKCMTKQDSNTKIHFNFYTSTNANSRKGSKAGLDGQGPYFNLLQRKLAAHTHNNLPPNIKNAICQDIQLYRMSEIIRQRKLRLSPEEELALIERTRNAPTIKEFVNEGYEEQVINLVKPNKAPRPNMR